MPTAKRNRCSAILRNLHYELDTSKLFFYHRDWRFFTYTAWLPFKRYHQLVYIAYRWLLVLYFFIWLVISGQQDDVTFFIYLTNWSFLAFNLYLLIAAISTTMKYIHYHWIKGMPGNHFYSTQQPCSPDVPVGYFDYANNSLKWYQMIHWMLFSLGNGAAVCVVVLFWSMLYRGGDVSGVSANHHLINGILAVVDVFVSGLPVNLLHVIYLMGFGITYSTFAGVYSLSSGENIYPVLDYQNRAGSAVILGVLVAFLLVPLIQGILYGVFLGRTWIIQRMKKKNIPVEENMDEVELTRVTAPTKSHGM